MTSMWLTAGIFLLTYGLIVTERIHRTLAALLGGMAVIIIGVLPQSQAFATVDWNVIFLLTGMMALANILRETGLFQWIALQAVRLGRGRPFAILVILVLVTALSSAFLDNVTIVVLVAPVTLLVAAGLGVSPIPYLIAEILASNIGGMATLIGDPPNILIGSAAGLAFVPFLANLAPISALILLAFLGFAWLLFRKELRADPGDAAERPGTAGDPLGFGRLDAASLITNRRNLLRGLIVMGAVIGGFLLQGLLGLQPATVALTGATVLMIWTRSDPREVLRDVEWATLLFFVGLFVLVEAVVQVGLIERVAQLTLELTGGDLRLTSTALLWFSAIASGVIDNIPYTAAMIPVVQSLGDSMRIDPLWWALALGACLGGNGTLIGASANVVVASLAEQSGHRISFRHFLAYGLPVTLLSLLMASGYLWLRYL